MTEAVPTIHSSAVDLLLSDFPNEDLFFTPAPSKTAQRHGRRALQRLFAVVQASGTPTLERLGMDKAKVMLSSLEAPWDQAEPQSMLVQMGDLAVVVKERLASPEQIEANLQELAAWVDRSLLRQVVIPFYDRKITVVVSDDLAEQDIKTKYALVGVEKAAQIPLPPINRSSCSLMFRSDVWRSAKGYPAWMKFPLTETDDPRGLVFNPTMVRCVEGVLTLTQAHTARGRS